MTSSSPRNQEIEALRAIAVLMTCISHLPQLMPFHEWPFIRFFSVYMPWTGVDLFFCISGYVVSRSVVAQIDQYKATGRFWEVAQVFWIRRLYRLIPSAWLWVLMGIIAASIFNTTGIFSTFYQNLRSATAVLTLSGNLAWQYDKMLAPNGVYWSLALEEQFYLLFPFFLLLTRSSWRASLLLLFIVIQFPVDRNPFGTTFAAFASFFRLDALMWGILIFSFSRSVQYRLFEPVFLKNARWQTFLLNLLLIYLLGAIAGQLIKMPIAVGLIALVAAVLVWLASYEAGYILLPPFLGKCLIWVGTRSYAIYLIHMFAYRFCFEAWSRHASLTGHSLDGTYTLRLLLSAMLLTLLLAELNYRFVEEPLRRRGAAIAARRLARIPETT